MNANQQTGVEEYQRALGVDVSGRSNTGIVDYNLQLLASNTCFRARAQALYSELNTMIGTTSYSNTLQSTLPMGTYAPGFLWQLAMKHAGDDPNLAMALIGICGHDDVAQLGDNHSIIAQGRVASYSGVTCIRRGSPIYIPGALGAEADITPQLRSRIAQVQAADADASIISAKYYHVMGAASTSCILLRRGVPVAMARTAAVTAVNAYRSARLCKDILNIPASPQEVSILEDFLSGTILMPTQPEAASYANYGSAEPYPAGNVISTPPNSPAPPSATGGSLNSASLIHSAPFLNFDTYEPAVKVEMMKYSSIFQLPMDVARKKIQRQVSILNAQRILLSDQNIQRECSASPHISMALVNYFKNNEHRKPGACPTDLTPQRCEDARHRIDTWAVDREWTEAQHLAGFEFARNHCQPTYNDEGALERSACRAQEDPHAHETIQRTGVAQ